MGRAPDEASGKSGPPPIRAAVIGIGKMGSRHAGILAAMAGVKLAAVVDTDAARLAQAPRQDETLALSDWHDPAPDLDAVFISSPTRFHAEMARHFLLHGVSVLVEKPIAKTVEEADAMIEAAELSGAILQVGHVERFNPAVMALQKHIVNPLFIESERISPFSFRSMDIGVVLDLMIHDIDIILHLVSSDIKELDAVGFGMMTAAEDIANARISFRNGAIADVTASRLSDKTTRKIRVFSRDGYVSMDYVARKAILYRPTEKLLAADFDPAKIDLTGLSEIKDAVFPGLVSVSEIVMDRHDPLTLQAQSFIDAVRTGSEPLVSGRHGRRALAAATTIVERIKSHEWNR